MRVTASILSGYYQGYCQVISGYCPGYYQDIVRVSAMLVYCPATVATVIVPGSLSLSLPAKGGDLNGVASFEKLDVKGLCTLGTVVVDYRGVRVVCQTIIPGEGGDGLSQSLVDWNSP